MPSLLAEERKALSSLLGDKVTALVTGVVKCFIGLPGQDWIESLPCVGVALVIDRTPPKSYHVKLFSVSSSDPIRVSIKGSFELYEGFAVQQLLPHFIAFETDGALVGLNFADLEEARSFCSSIAQFSPKPGSCQSASKSNSSISGPTNFKHNAHIGFSADSGFDFNNLPKEMIEVFKQAGISKAQLQNPETAKLVYNTLEQNREELSRMKMSMGPPPPAPPYGAAAPPAPIRTAPRTFLFD